VLNRPSTTKIWLLTIATLGLYYVYWCAQSGKDINTAARAKLVPSAWYLIVPGLNYYWVWQYATALESVSYKRINRSNIFLVYVIGMNFATLPFGIFRYFNFSTSSSQPSFHTVVTILVIAVCIAAVATVMGAAFFCSYAQNQINQVAKPKAA
jgi:uncharacterized membrane protein